MPLWYMGPVVYGTSDGVILALYDVLRWLSCKRATYNQRRITRRFGCLFRRKKNEKKTCIASRPC